jgi:hypothetical protein
MEAAAYALEHVSDGLTSQSGAAFKLLSASAGSAVAATGHQDWARAAEDMEFAIDSIEHLGPEVFTRESLDLCLLLGDLASQGNRESDDDFIADKNRELAARFTERRRRSDPSHLDRVIGSVDNLVEGKGYGFINSEGRQYFLHSSALWDRRFFDEMQRGSKVAFAPGAKVPGKTALAVDVYWVA